MASLVHGTGGKKTASCHMMNRAQIIMPLEMPAILAMFILREHTLIGMGSHHFGNEQIISVLVMRLRDDFTFQPCHAAFEQRRIDCFGRESLQVIFSEFIGTFQVSA